MQTYYQPTGYWFDVSVRYTEGIRAIGIRLFENAATGEVSENRILQRVVFNHTLPTQATLTHSCTTSHA